MHKTQRFSFIALIVLFFLWGLLTSLNDILVPHMKGAFNLKNWQAQLIQFFFFGAYFIMSIPAGMIIRKVGYKRGIVIGLMLMGLGCFVFYPASELTVYGIFLLGLFILASGITILQVAANPYVAVIGPEETAASRLNLAQGVNSVGHTIAPLFGAWLILQNTEIVDVKTVQGPYIFLAIALIIIGVVFLFLHLPNIEYEEVKKEGFQLSRYPHLYLGAIAIFCYVGAEIAIGSFLVEYFRTDPTIALDNKTAGSHVAFYWGGAMVGRFLGAISLSRQNSFTQKALKLLPVPLLAIAVVFAVITINQLSTSVVWGFGTMLILSYLAFLFGRSKPNSLMSLFAVCAMVLLTVTMLGSGKVALWAVLGVGLFNSIMWSNIFTLAISGLKQFTSYGSSLLVMMIMGGAIIPILQGVVADTPLGVKFSFLVPFAAYAYLVFYGLKGYKRQEVAGGI
ncbi:MAG: sugar MFS transporter [Phaeodactylibacter sp.]|nr:sugar MFS transporter [Phaeodactylibacter sp.]MCB9303239.1 sugar MFS transporter [Lewinellaceae bacterium]